MPATLNRWVIDYSPLIAAEAKKRKRSAASSWRMDETYVKVKGQWVYLYRAVDKFGDTIDFMVYQHRDEAEATAFFKQAIDANRLMRAAAFVIFATRPLKICMSK